MFAPADPGHAWPSPPHSLSYHTIRLLLTLDGLQPATPRRLQLGTHKRSGAAGMKIEIADDRSKNQSRLERWIQFQKLHEDKFEI